MPAFTRVGDYTMSCINVKNVRFHFFYFVLFGLVFLRKGPWRGQIRGVHTTYLSFILFSTH